MEIGQSFYGKQRANALTFVYTGLAPRQRIKHKKSKISSQNDRVLKSAHEKLLSQQQKNTIIFNDFFALWWYLISGLTSAPDGLNQRPSIECGATCWRDALRIRPVDSAGRIDGEIIWHFGFTNSTSDLRVND